MIAVLAHHADGGCMKLFVVSREFDLQTWAERKRPFLEFLRVTRLETIELC